MDSFVDRHRFASVVDTVCHVMALVDRPNKKYVMLCPIHTADVDGRRRVGVGGVY